MGSTDLPTVDKSGITGEESIWIKNQSNQSFTWVSISMQMLSSNSLELIIIRI